MKDIAFQYECGCSIAVQAIAPEVSVVRCKEHARVAETSAEQLIRHELIDQIQQLQLQLHLELEEKATQDLLISGMRKLLRDYHGPRLDSMVERELSGELE
jgi:hypothetical protein